MKQEEQKQVENDKQSLLRDVRLMLESPYGKNVLFELIKRSGVMDNTFYPGSERADCYASGRKSLGYEFLELMNFATVDGYYEFKRMQVEQLKRRSIVKEHFGER